AGPCTSHCPVCTPHTQEGRGSAVGLERPESHPVAPSAPLLPRQRPASRRPQYVTRQSPTFNAKATTETLGSAHKTAGHGRDSAPCSTSRSAPYLEVS